MDRNKKVLSSIFLLILCLTIVYSDFANQTAKASSSTLADALNATINNVNWNAADSWTSNWAIILAGQGNGAFDNAISADVNGGNYIDALYVARLAQLSGYSSDIITQNTITALQQISMCGSLPITANAHSYGDPDKLNTGCYSVYDRFTLWADQYAKTYGLDNKWNATQAFINFANAYDKKSTGSVSGEMLWCDPQENWAASYSSRYYDEHAQTLSTFLQFAEQGVPNALSYADKAWTGVQAHWNGQYYGYTGTSTVECEMGNFAQVIAEYKDLKGGTIPYWDRVISDLNYKLLANGWSSPGWASPGVIIHAKGVNNELRLWETAGAIIALQSQYPYFSSTMKTNWQNMLSGSSPAWQGLMSSSLNQGGRFSGVSGTAVTNDATVCAAATLFLEGIVPVTGNLNIPNINEQYDDQRTPFSTSNFKFDYANHLITIPVNAGTLNFIYGTSPVSYTFPSNGVYKIQFSSDWNQITAVNDQPVVTYPPSAPLNLQATGGNGQVSLSWSAPSSNGGAPITGYTIYKSTVQGQEIKSVTLPSTSNSYTDSSVTNGQAYYYTITATNTAGESSQSNEATATPTAPKTITATIKTDKATYNKGSTVLMTVTAKDSSSTASLNGATAAVTILSPYGSTLWTGKATTNTNGIATLSYRLSNGAQRGTYTVTATVTDPGYLAAKAQTTFKI
jgi:hypothetical protein